MGVSGVPAQNRATLTTGSPNYYSSGPATILKLHRGIMFPNQPNIVYGQSVNYSPYDLVHTNYTLNAYRNTPSSTLNITAQFSQVTDEEHEYLQGVIHFLRSVTKMYYGKNEGANPRAGTPPPVLRFSAFGSNIFNNVPVLVSDFSMTFDENVDLKTFNEQSLPTIQSITLTLLVQQTPAKQKESFTLSGFISGGLYGQGFI
jgi:hypothetical protein